jgi:galactokinase
MTGLATRAQHDFMAVFGYPPQGIWSAPGRVNLIGEHTDYNEGFVLPFAIDRRTFAALALRDDRLVRVSSSAVGGIGEFGLSDVSRADVRGWAAYPIAVTWALGQFGADLARLPGFDVHFVSDVPLGAGLSSSAALESALGIALNEAWRLGFARAQLVAAAHQAENAFVGAPTGILDQSASLLAQEGAALFIDCRDGTSSPVDLRLDEYGLTVLVIDTKIKHDHVSGGYAARRATCEKAARALGARTLRDVSVPQLLAARGRLDDETYRRARHVVTEDQRVLDTVGALRAGDLSEVGELMSASHRSMRDDFEISTPELDLAVEMSLSGGAIGARMTGGGFGGSAIALAPAAQIPPLRVAITSAFSRQSYPQPKTFAVRPSHGARREQ